MLELALQSSLDAHQDRCIKMAYSSAESLLAIINDILDLSKIEADKLHLDAAPMDLSEVLEDVAHLISPAARSKGVEVTIDCRPGLPHCFVGDSVRLRQILTNLARNAVKFISRGHVLLSVRCEIRERGLANLHLSFRTQEWGFPKIFRGSSSSHLCRQTAP
jgi:two-component system, sensor histidine kinase and response regulator